MLPDAKGGALNLYEPRLVAAAICTRGRLLLQEPRPVRWRPSAAGADDGFCAASTSASVRVTPGFDLASASMSMPRRRTTMDAFLVQRRSSPGFAAGSRGERPRGHQPSWP